MKDAVEDVPASLRLTFSRERHPRALTILVKATSTIDRDDLVLFNLASRPFMRDLISNRLVIFWELLRPAGACLLLRTQDNFHDIEELARLEVRFISDELMRLRRNPSMAHIS